MKQEFIKIADKRYRTSTIKRYEPVPGDGLRLHIYFSPTGHTQRVTHKFASASACNNAIEALDDLFQV